MEGSYLLVIKVKNQTTIKIGAKGLISFKRGIYIYVGSAMGNGSTSLVNRVTRHLRRGKSKSLHWHIDYLLESEVSTIIRLYLLPCKEKSECGIASMLEKAAEGYVNGFGCSDCNCQSHLFYYASKRDLKAFFENC